MALAVGRMVVVGAGLAGLRAVQGARRAGFVGSIILVGAEDRLPYDRPPLSKGYITGEVADAVPLVERSELSALDVDVRLGTPASELDLDRKVLQVADSKVAYDRLVIATGADARLPVAADVPGVLRIRTLSDADQVRTRLADATSLLIVGAGFVGAELASSARALGVEVTMVEAADVPLIRATGPLVGGALSTLHTRNNTRLVCGTTVTSISPQGGGYRVKLSSSEELVVDAVVVGVGAAPSTGWLANSGLKLDPVDGGVLCDEFLRTSDPDVFAAGDLVHWPNSTLARMMRLENWTSAAEQGAQAGANAVAATELRAFATVPYFWSDWYGHRIQMVGTTDAETVEFVHGDPGTDHFVAFFYDHELLVGVATLNEPRKVMKFRRLIGQGGTRHDALAMLAKLAAPN